MNIQFIYDIFLTSTKNKCFDLVVQALPMLLSDARTGVRQYTDEATDLTALHAAYPVLAEEDGPISQFIGRHYDALVEAYKLRDRAAFDAVSAQCAAEDKAREEAREAQAAEAAEDTQSGEEADAQSK